MKSLLSEPFRIGRMEIRNRIVMAPMATKYGGEMGQVTERIKDHYEARARGGVGLIIIEFTYVHLRGQVCPNQLGLSNDSFIPDMSELVKVIHKHGAKAALQLQHGGREARSIVMHMQPVAPSPLPGSHGELPKELTIDEIGEIINCFAQATTRARMAGFDGVEIHGAHGYLIDQFLSRSANKRRDAYGGDLASRARLLIEVIKTTRGVVGRDYPLWCRLNGREYGIIDGTTLEEAKQIARMAQDAGADAIYVTAWGPGSPTIVTTPTFTPAVIEDLAEGIKEAVSVPVIAVGRITPEAGERMLAQGKADLISIAKGLLADPRLPNK